jgi:uncharacterized protein (DUF111 family)
MIREAEKKYKKTNIKRVPLDMQISEYEEIKKTADKYNVPVNFLIKTAIKHYLGDLKYKE